MDDRGGRGLLDLFLELRRELLEVLDVVAELLFVRALSRRADDDRRPLGAIFLHDLLETRSLAPVVDALAHADVVEPGHENGVAAGERDLARDAGPLRADRFLADLDEDVLALFEEVFDRRQLAALLRVAIVLVEELRIDRPGRHVAHVEKRRLLLADVDERGLNAGDDGRDAAEVHVPDGPAAVLALDEKLDELAILHDRDSDLAGRKVDENLRLHRAPGFLAGNRRVGRLSRPPMPSRSWSHAY